MPVRAITTGTRVSRNRDIGTKAETASAQALQRLLCFDEDDLERDGLHGAKDRGDIRMRRKKRVCFEVKGGKQANWQPWAWLIETETERVNAAADYGIVIIKPPGVGYGRGEKFLTLMRLDEASRLHIAAGSPRIRSVAHNRVGINAGLKELAERERHCGDVPVEVIIRQAGSELRMSLMRLDARCSLLVAAGYSGC